MNELQIFENPEFGKIRTVSVDGDPWLVARMWRLLWGIAIPAKALADHVEVEDKGVTKCDTLGGAQELTIINESGVYSMQQLQSALRREKLGAVAA